MKKILKILCFILVVTLIIYGLFIIEERFRLKTNVEAKPLIVLSVDENIINVEEDEYKEIYNSLGFKLENSLHKNQNTTNDNVINGQELTLFGKIRLFAWIADDTDSNEDYTFYGKVLESNLKYIIIEPNEDEKERESSDKITISLEESNDVLYKVGTIVKISYNGEITESYPAHINANKIESKSIEQFSLVFYQEDEIQPKHKEIVINKNEIEDIDYNVYAFDGNISINLNGEDSELKEESILLRNAILQKKITIDEIIAKANRDLEENMIQGDMYKDGGSMIYKYSNYTIIKCHTVNGNRDVYIGSKDMTINDIEI